MSAIKLKGMTWSHPRGIDPMVACSRQWREKTGVEIAWDKRSLQDFESYPVDELARRYDLIVIDHPHVGQITAEDCLAPLDVQGREAERAALAQGSVGRSYASYQWQGRQWAFPIDAAAQVHAFRPDLLARVPTVWTEILELARGGRVLLPLKPPHSLMCFFTLAANLGTPCASEKAEALIAPEAGEKVFEILREIADAAGSDALAMDPIAVLEAMVAEGAAVACAPLIYGYVNYAMAGFRRHRLVFVDIPTMGTNAPRGSALGGTGIAVSAFSSAKAAAIDFAYWIAGGETQRGAYAAAGGQPGHADAWDDEAINAATGNFYRATRATLEGAWLRPRHDGYMAFQEKASARLNEGLLRREDGGRVVADLNMMFSRSKRG